MASNPAQLGAVEYADEASFGENVATWDARLPALGKVDVSGLVQPKIPIDILRQRMNEGTQDLRGAYGGSVSLEFMLPGLGASQSGAVSTTDMATFLGLIVGTSASSASAGTTVSSATDGDTFVTAASGTFSPGAILRVGAITDARALGQAGVVQTHTGTAMQLLTALPGTPASPDVVYTGQMIYPNENPSNAGDITSLRLGLKTANQQYICHGCYPTSLEFSGLGPGMQPKFKVSFNVAWWEQVNATFPVATAIQTHSGMTVAGGSFFYNANGTATRATRTIRDFTLSIDMESMPLMGPGGNDNFQAIVGARRVKQTARINWVEDAEAAGTDTIGSLWTTDENSITNRHALYSLNARNGATAAFYFPNLVPEGNRPVQFEQGGLNVMRWSFRCDTSTVTTSALTLSSWRLYLG